MQDRLKACAKMGNKEGSFLPLKNLFKNTTPAPSLDQNQPKNSKNNSLAPQQLRYSVILGALVQKYEQKHPLEHYYTHNYRERGDIERE